MVTTLSKCNLFASIICMYLVASAVSSRADLDAMDADETYEQSQQGFPSTEEEIKNSSIFVGGGKNSSEDLGNKDLSLQEKHQGPSHALARRITDSGMLNSDVPPASIARSWVDMSLGEASQVDTNSAHRRRREPIASRAIDGSVGTHSETLKGFGRWWQVQFDFRLKVTGVEIYMLNGGGDFQSAPLSISVDSVVCAIVTTYTGNLRTFVPCSRPVYGRTVRIEPATRSNVLLQITEVRIEEEPTGRDEVAPEDLSRIICPFLSTLVHEKMLHGCEHTNETLLQATIDAGLERSKAMDHVLENFINNPSGRQNICDMEGALNEHLTSTLINDCHTDFEAQGPCQPRHGDTPASCAPVTASGGSCGVPNANAFQQFWAKLKAGSPSTWLSTTELEANAHLIDVVDGNPVGLGTIIGSYSLLLSVFGVNGSIHKTNLERVLLQRKFPIGYSIPPPL